MGRESHDSYFHKKCKEVSDFCGSLYDLFLQTSDRVSCKLPAVKIVAKRKLFCVVVGAAIQQTKIQDIFSKYVGPSCFGIDATVHCYLIDDNGFVVASSRRDVEVRFPSFVTYTIFEVRLILTVSSAQPGTFLGEVDPQVTDDLLMSGLYRQQERYNFQGYCLRGTTEATQASGNLRPTIFALAWQLWSNLFQILSGLKFLLFRYKVGSPSRCS